MVVTEIFDAPDGFGIVAQVINVLNPRHFVYARIGNSRGRLLIKPLCGLMRYDEQEAQERAGSVDDEEESRHF